MKIENMTMLLIADKLLTYIKEECNDKSTGNIIGAQEYDIVTEEMAHYKDVPNYILVKQLNEQITSILEVEVKRVPIVEVTDIKYLVNKGVYRIQFNIHSVKARYNKSIAEIKAFYSDLLDEHSGRLDRGEAIIIDTILRDDFSIEDILKEIPNSVAAQLDYNSWRIMVLPEDQTNPKFNDLIAQALRKLLEDKELDVVTIHVDKVRELHHLQMYTDNVIPGMLEKLQKKGDDPLIVLVNSNPDDNSIDIARMQISE